MQDLYQTAALMGAMMPILKSQNVYRLQYEVAFMF